MDRRTAHGHGPAYKSLTMLCWGRYDERVSLAVVFKVLSAKAKCVTYIVVHTFLFLSVFYFCVSLAIANTLDMATDTIILICSISTTDKIPYELTSTPHESIYGA